MLIVLLAATIGAICSACGPSMPPGHPKNGFAEAFATPSSVAKPWVYWYFMDGHITREGIVADLQAMKTAGIGGAIFLTVDIGVPRGPVVFASPEWQDLLAFAVQEADRQGIEITLGVGPGWTGSGGPWVKPDDAMQHLVGSVTTVKGGAPVEVVLEQPKPRDPFFGRGSLTPALMQLWERWYRDVAVIAYPTPKPGAAIADVNETAIYFRAPYSSQPGVRPYLDAPAVPSPIDTDQCLQIAGAIDLSGRLDTAGRLKWDAPAGDWTICRFGMTLTGQTTRPAPEAGLGFECDKFTRHAIESHLSSFMVPLLEKVGKASGPHRGLTRLHFDSWEMSSQNWSAGFAEEFLRRRGYDPKPYLPAMLGMPVQDAATSQRFLWDLRQTARELVYDNDAVVMRDFAHAHGLAFSVEPYDMNPSADLKLGASADFPMGEFWSKEMGFNSEFSVIEAVAVGHTNGHSTIGAESFTADDRENWQQYPARMKAQTDWAFAAGLNHLAFHRFQHQPRLDQFPGMRMGPYGVHWDRTQTWWPMVGAYHAYVTRCSDVLRRGLPVADVLYLMPEGAPHVFRPPGSAVRGLQMDRRGYNFDGCDPDTLIERATVRDQRVVFPDGMSYRVLVLPRYDTMTPALLKKVKQLVEDGATVIGSAPLGSPSLSGQPAADQEVAALATGLWGAAPFGHRAIGKGLLVNDSGTFSTKPTPSLLAEANWIGADDGKPDAMAAPGVQYFRKSFALDATARSSAQLIIAADDRFKAFVNGQPVGEAVGFRSALTYEIASKLKTGENTIDIEVTNDGTSPNPTGLLASIRIETAPERIAIDSDKTWLSKASPDAPLKQSKVIADPPREWAAAKSESSFRDLYPDYDFTAHVLASAGVAPDFDSEAELRYTHRRDGNADLYFVANPSDAAVTTNVTFRVTGRQPEWWNPVTGEKRALHRWTEANGRTAISLTLGATESGFVIFEKVGRAPALSTDAPTVVEKPVLPLTGSWTVAFDPAWGGPASATFERLEDWSKRPEDGIRNYSGQAVYRTAFDFKTPLDTKRVWLSLGNVHAMARVTLNGKDLGVVWCPPWNVEVPASLLRESGNELEITVANLWINRLIADAGLPPEQRKTVTTSNPYPPGARRQPSGLLGPVEIKTTHE